MKRLIDVFASAVGLLSLFPLLILLIVAIRMESAGPGVFRQTRIGRHKKNFTCYKLRSMSSDTLDKPSHMVETASVTRIGRFIRKTKLDELPQLWNVLKGEMSLVGPRPCLPSQVELIDARDRHGLHQLRPGITGISQVRGIDMSVPQRLADSDAEYLDNISVRNDLHIILKSVLGAGQGDRVGKLD